MKLATFEQNGIDRLGAVMADQVLDLAAAASYIESLTEEFPSDLLTCLVAWEKSRQQIQTILKWFETNEDSKTAPVHHPLSQVQIRPLLRNPGKIICVGLNYADHCREQNLEIPNKPILFAKFPSAVIGPEEGICWPKYASSQVDFEAELAVVIGRQAKGIPRDKALDYVAGYTIVNDVSARDAQFSDGQWIRGKSFDTFCPIGPYLVTPDEVGDPQNLKILCRVNGELFQDSNTSQMIFGVRDIIAYICQTSTLYPGDVICTGTPDGVGVFRSPKVFLNSGDVIEIEIEGLGFLRNPVL